MRVLFAWVFGRSMEGEGEGDNSGVEGKRVQFPDSRCVNQRFGEDERAGFSF